MVENQNKEINNSLVRQSKVSGFSQSQININPNVQPILDVNPEKFVNKVYQDNTSSTGSKVIATTSTTKDTYISSVHMSFQTDDACDNSYVGLAVTMDGGLQYIAYVRKISLTAQTRDVFFNFAHPIKVDRGGTIRLVTSFSAGEYAGSVSIHCIEVESLD